MADINAEKLADKVKELDGCSIADELFDPKNQMTHEKITQVFNEMTQFNSQLRVKDEDKQVTLELVPLKSKGALPLVTMRFEDDKKDSKPSMPICFGPIEK